MPNHSLSLLMLDRCDIQRYTTTYNTHNQPVKNWITHKKSVKCRLVVTKQQIANEDVGFQTIEVYNLTLPASTDVTQDDRISNVQASIPVHTNYRIESVFPRRLFGKPQSVDLVLEKI